jgi:PAS domain S-box-containing protein
MTHPVASAVKGAAALAEFGRRAIAADDPTALLDDAVQLAAAVLRVPLCAILAVDMDERSGRMVAGFGWPAELVGATTHDLTLPSQATYTLQQDGAVVVEDFATETRFQGHDLLRARGVVSGLSVVIRGHHQSFGVLGAHATERRVFTADDIDFAEAIAGLLGQAMLRQRAEQALRESEQRLQLAVESANLGLWDWDVPGQRIYYSPRWKALLGYADDELQADTSLWETLLHPEDRAAAQARLRAFLRQPIGAYEDEFRLRHRDGSYRWIRSHAMPIVGANGRPARMIGVHVDFTGRREAEDAVRRLNADLEARVTERTAQLEVALRELEAFSYSVSHDLRAPLRAIDGFAQALAEELPPDLPNGHRHYLQRVRAAAQRMGSLIDDLLQLSRVSRHELSHVAVDLSTLAREIESELRRAQPGRQVTFSVAPGMVARGDPHLLRTALDNLLGNAWKYTSKHSSAHIAFGAERIDGERVFVLRDDGAGFDPAYADKLFGAFQRLHAPGEFEGTGIGLATVQRIVQRHHGRIWAEGAVERGATFYFTLAE